MLCGLCYAKAVKQSTKDNWDFIMSKFWRSQLDMPEQKPKFTQIWVLLTSKIPHKENYKLASIRFKRLSHWFRFLSPPPPPRCGGYILVRSGWTLSESSIFWNGRNNVTFFICKIPIKRIVFSDCLRFWNSQSLPQQRSKHSATPSARQIFLQTIFCVVTWPAATRVFLPTSTGGRGERACSPLLFPRRINLGTRLQQPESFTFSRVTLKSNYSFTGHQLHLSQHLLETVKKNRVCGLSVLVPSRFLQQALGPSPHSEDVCQSTRQNKAKWNKIKLVS